MKWSPRDLSDMEQRVRTVKTSVANLCRRADVSHSCWRLWKKAIVAPRPGNWEKVERAMRQLEAEYFSARAA